MRNKKLSGFSLVELIVVVSIIGLLASMAIPAMEKFSSKARQSEAKNQLAALYLAEKAFFAEYGGYHSSFASVGYAPEGSIRYTVGFAESVAAGIHVEAGAAQGYGVIDNNLNNRNSGAYCANELGVGGQPGNNCRRLKGTNNMAHNPLIFGIPVTAALTVTPEASGNYPAFFAPVVATDMVSGCIVRTDSLQFEACAGGVVYKSLGDVWTINHLKVINNPSVGL